jgi:hypothetical protein
VKHVSKTVFLISLAAVLPVLNSLGLTVSAEVASTGVVDSRPLSEDDYYPQTCISSPDGQFITDLDSDMELFYTLNIPDAGKLAGGMLRVTILSVRNDASLQTAALQIALTQDGVRIPSVTYTVGPLWSDFWNVDLTDSATKYWMENAGVTDGPMTAQRSYMLPVTAGTNEFIVTDGFHTFRLMVNVAGARLSEMVPAISDVSGANPPTGAGFLPVLPAVLLLAAAIFAATARGKRRA